MRNNQNSGCENFILVIPGVCGSIFCIYIGYLIAAVIGYVQDNSSDLLTGISMILSKPFARYFNKYTPITMILGFIVFEGIFFLIFKYCKKIKYNERKVLADSDIIAAAEKSFENNVQKNVFENNNDLFNEVALSDNNDLDTDTEKTTYVSPKISEETVSVNSVSASTEKDNISDKIVENEMSLSDEIVTELLNDYDLLQIKAMLALKAHIDYVDVFLLKRMFKPTMSADEIAEYIKIFYD